ncbi:hypothetical protein PRK78_006775 [Emydomyces testavorans]|uniref:Uncharacterized protein n=1 Tax=Emydomyces testavorans TaxID=2070801 RepID=A0AAF0IKU6_9EURO|nr:hypothetical protein PRK78_006775 [Emydomyces testavorans]
MGRRGYMTMIALGRSPYDAPEPVPEQYVPMRNPLYSTNADGYIQQYDDRGHPTNPESKALAKQLRRAKNDILSTMGIVVSGEDGKSGSAKDREKAELLTTENAYGIIIATIDQIAMFTTSWWASSLTARLQTFKHFNEVPLMQIWRFERRRHGFFTFYFAGMPSWVCSFFLAICRTHFVDSPLDYADAKLASLFQNKQFRRVIRGCSTAAKLGIKFVLVGIIGQTYMFSLLQTLHLIPAFAAPSLRSFLPFGEYSLVQLPPFPSVGSVREIGKFIARLIFSPFSLVYFLTNIRPVVETRIYRLLRRRLPKPDRPDRLSVRVAFEGDLIEWTVPTLGKRSREEVVRGQLSMTEDIIFEIAAFQRWFMSIFDWERWFNKGPPKPERGATMEGRNESLHRRVEQLRRDLPNNRAADGDPSPTVQASARAGQREPEDRTRPDPVLEEDELRQILTGEDQRLAQSPIQLREDYFPDMSNMDDILPDDRHTGPPISEQPSTRDVELPQRRRSRANTLFSRPSSPDLSPLTSPRVRASLVHQNSDVITMQLELLQSSRHSNSQNQGDNNNGGGGSNVSNEGQQNREPQSSAIDRAASELLDALLSNHAHNRPDVAPRFHEELDTSMPSTTVPTAGAEAIQPTPTIMAAQFDTAGAELQSTEQPSTADQQQDTDEESPHPRQPLRSRSQRRTSTFTNMDRATLPDHRVTILSTHPVDSLASHLAVLLTSVLLYPLESVALRSLALNYLSSRAPFGILSRTSPAPAGIITGVGLSAGASMYSIRPLGSWFGGGSLSDRLSFIGKMALIMGLEVMSRAGLWGIGTAVALTLGRRKFGWGEL